MCDCSDDSLIPMKTESYVSTVDEYVFYPVSDWKPSFETFRSALRLLAEQGDGLEIRPAFRTATVRYDMNGPQGLNPWSFVGTPLSVDGTADPELQNIAALVSGEFWTQLGLAVKKGAGAGLVGQGQAGVQIVLPRERVKLVANPVVLDTVSVPVGSVPAEVMTTKWMSREGLREVSVAYDIYDADNYSMSIVLQSAKSDPSQEILTEDTIASGLVGPTAGAVRGSSFPGADANGAQLFRVVIKAQAASTGEGKARVFLAVGVEYD